MKKTIGLMVKPAASGMAERSLLGKQCADYVKESMLAAGVMLAEDDEAFTASFDRVLLVREDAPCLTPETLTALISAVSVNNASAGTLLAQNTQEPLAMALSQEKWAALCKTQGVRPSEAARRLFAVRDGQGSSLNVHRANAPETCFAVCDAASYAKAYRLVRDTLVQKHLTAGVIILDPARTIIEAHVRVGAGTLIYPDNILQGTTAIGAGCTLYPNNRMQNAVVGDETTIENSVLLDCAVGSHTTVGPFAYLRPDTKVGDHCRIGDFVEVKNSAIGDGTKVSHLTYVGDSDLGKDINLGCGVVFVNYDGKTKNRSTVEDHAFIGCNCNIVAPAHIGKSAYLAAGSTVVGNVPADALYIARSQGVIKQDWVIKRKMEGKL